MINLFEKLDEKSVDLMYSLSCIERDQTSVIINDNGWLEPNMISPFSFYSKSYEGNKGKAVYFNEINVPDWWGIRGNDQIGEIYDNENVKARIFYHTNREVERVEWLNNQMKVQFIDYYNRCGIRYARGYYHKHQLVQKSYFSPDEEEIIVHNLITGQVVLNQHRQKTIFSDLVSFVVYFIKDYFHPLQYKHILYNSLSLPLFVVNSLQHLSSGILIWEEAIHEEIPGNMLEILNNKTSNTQRIFFQNQDDMRKVLQGNNFLRQDIISYLGKLYKFEPLLPLSNHTHKSAIIVTNSDEIWELGSIVNELPNIDIKLLALTEMSQKLMKMDRFENVSLYPAASPLKISECIKEADYLLDINFGNEVLNSVRKAFLSHTIILSSADTIHNLNFTSRSNIYHNYSDVVRLISSTCNNSLRYTQVLSDQENLYGKQGTVDYYQKVFKDIIQNEKMSGK